VADPEYGDRLFVHDRSSLFRLPAGRIVRATNPATTLNPSFAMGREDRGEVSRFWRASLRAGVARLLARSAPVNKGIKKDQNPDKVIPWPFS
jgi:hypothetical protein